MSERKFLKFFLVGTIISVSLGVMLSAPVKAQNLPPVSPVSSSGVRLSVPLPGADSNPPIGSVSSLNQYVQRIYTFAIILAAVFAFLFIVIGALQYIISRGNTSKIMDAKDRITSSILGLLLLIGAVLLLKTINPVIVQNQQSHPATYLPSATSTPLTASNFQDPYPPSALVNGLKNLPQAERDQHVDRLNRVYKDLGSPVVPGGSILAGDKQKQLDFVYKGSSVLNSNYIFDPYRYFTHADFVQQIIQKHGLSNAELDAMKDARVYNKPLEIYLADPSADINNAYTNTHLFSVLNILSGGNGFFSTLNSFQDFVDDTKNLDGKIRDNLNNYSVYNYLMDLELAEAQGDNYTFVYCVYQRFGTGFLNRPAANQINSDDLQHYKDIETGVLQKWDLLKNNGVDYCSLNGY